MSTTTDTLSSADAESFEQSYRITRKAPAAARTVPGVWPNYQEGFDMQTLLGCADKGRWAR